MKIVIKNVRLSFPKLFEATQFKGTGPARYEAQFMVEPSSEAHKAIEDAISEVAHTRFGGKAATTLKKLRASKQTCCYVPGELTGREENEGQMVLSSNRKEKDGPVAVFDKSKTRLHTDTGVIYAGCYVNASVDIWAQDGQYPGIRATLVGVQFAGDSDAFGGGPLKSTGDEFDALDDDTGEGEDLL